VRKLWFRRRGVSTMIGGIIFLMLLLTALAAMILVNQQYDAYQTTANAMQQRDNERFAENLKAVPPAIFEGNPFSVTCAGGGNCNTYTMTIANLNIGLQIARIYIKNASATVGCTNLCVLDPAASAAPNAFLASDRYVNPGELHNVTFWLPENIILPREEGGKKFGLNSIWIATMRGRVFSFQWPLPPPGPAGGIAAGGPGGTGLYIGPLVITFQKALIAYTTNSSGKINVPQGGINGYWAIPSPELVIYIKIQTDIGTPNDVYLTAQSVLELAQFNSPGNVFSFFIVAPITPLLCAAFATGDQPPVGKGDIVCDPAFGYYSGGNNGDPNNLVAYQSCSQVPYSSCSNRYLIPRPNPQQLLNGERGTPVIVAFSANTASGDNPQTGVGGFNPGTAATSYLGLTYIYNDGIGDYTYAVTLPFIAVCINNPPSNPAQCPG